MNFERLDGAVKYCDSVFKPKQNVYHYDFSSVLIIDLTTERTETAEIPEQWQASYVSGPCLGARLWAHYSKKEDGYPVVLTAPAARNGSSVSVAFKSATSEKLVFNTINGDFAQKLINCRFAAVVIKGCLKTQGIIALSAGGAVIEKRSDLRQLSTSEVVSKLCIDNYNSCLTVGKAGENGVSFASCVCDGEFTGRYGLGAILGEKNIKAVTVTAVSDKLVPDTFKRRIPFVSIAGYRGWAPVRNFSDRTDPRLFHISESEFSRIIGPSAKLPSYEARLMLGSNTGCFDIRKVVERFNVCLENGLDPITVGSILGSAMQGQTDNSKVCSYIESLAEQGVEVTYMHLGSEACGPYDYRGNFVQAISDMSGNFFPVVFNANRLLCQNNFDFWACLSEDLTLGLESFGLNPDCMLRRVRNVGVAKAFLFRHNPKSADRYFSPEEQAEVLASQFKAKLVGQDIIDLGRTCKRLIYEINRALGAEEIRIPDLFTVEPESNHAQSTVVPAFSLMQAYRNRRDRLFAVQDSYLRKN